MTKRSNRRLNSSEDRDLVQIEKISDPTENVKGWLRREIGRLDDLRKAAMRELGHDLKTEIKRLDEKNKDDDTKYQIQFSAAKEALGIALIAQEKAVAAALDATKEAINKAEIATDKRFALLSEKIDGVSEQLNKNAGAQGIYVTHSDLSAEMEKLRTSFEGMLRPVVTFMNSQTGQQKGMGLSWGVLLGAIGLISAVIAIVSRFIS